MVSDRIKSAREKASLSIQAAADKLNISVEALAKYEDATEEPDTETLIKMSELYKVSVEEMRYGREAKMSIQTMFPKNVEPATSYLADWKFFVGAILMFIGLAGILILVMRAIGAGYTQIEDVFDYAAFSLIAFAATTLAGLLLCILTATINKKKKRNEKTQNRK